MSNTNEQTPNEERLPCGIALAVEALAGQHYRGCPEPPFKAEQYTVSRPPDAGGGHAVVSRCQQCGAHVVDGNRVEAVK